MRTGFLWNRKVVMGAKEGVGQEGTRLKWCFKKIQGAEMWRLDGRGKNWQETRKGAIAAHK